MAGEEGIDGQHRQCWTFTEEALARAREAAHTSATQALRGHATREYVRPLDLEEGARLVLASAQRLLELCPPLGAPPEAQWTAIVFFRRFFALRSPMEYDPLSVMLASINLACKVEEVHEITLDRLLEEAGLATEEGLRAKVAALEVPLLECLGFQLLVEPKPDTGLQVLVEDLQQFVAERQGGGPAAVTAEVLQRADHMVLQMSVRTDAVLRWPTSVLLAAALGAAMDEAAAAAGGSSGSGAAPSHVLASFLDARLEAEPQRAALRRMVEEATHCLRSPACSLETPPEAVQEAAAAARRCQRAFERMREEAAERHEAHRRERKRRWSQVKRRQVPTPVHHALLMRAAMIRGMPMQPAGAGAAAEAFGLADLDAEGFVIRRAREDMEDD